MRAVYLEEKEGVLSLIKRQKQKKKNEILNQLIENNGIFLNEGLGGPEKN